MDSKVKLAYRTLLANKTKYKVVNRELIYDCAGYPTYSVYNKAIGEWLV
jgi:hypothetical protein